MIVVTVLVLEMLVDDVDVLAVVVGPGVCVDVLAVNVVDVPAGHWKPPKVQVFPPKHMISFSGSAKSAGVAAGKAEVIFE